MLRKGVVVFADASQEARSRANAEIPALEHVANRPIAHHVFDALLGAAVQELIVAAPADVLIELRHCLRDYSPQPVEVKFAVCRDQVDLGSALEAVHPLIGAAPCVVHVADGLLGEPLSPHLEAMRTASADLLMFCHERGDGSAVGSAATLEARHGRRDACATAGVFAFGPGTLSRACESGARTAGCLSRVLADQLAESGGSVQIGSGERWCRYRGNPHDLLDLNRVALDEISPAVPEGIAARNRIEGRVRVDQTASVTDSVIVGPAVIGPRVNITSAYVGPYTSIGAGARIEGSEIERSIISPGASILHVGGRLTASLVGPKAKVFRDFSLPRALRLCVSGGDEVALC
jgi:glucose-1-phosphate thymidylyltransferase